MDGKGQQAKHFAAMWSDRRRSYENATGSVSDQLDHAVVADAMEPAASGVFDTLDRDVDDDASFASLGLGEPEVIGVSGFASPNEDFMDAVGGARIAAYNYGLEVLGGYSASEEEE